MQPKKADTSESSGYHTQSFGVSHTLIRGITHIASGYHTQQVRGITHGNFFKNKQNQPLVNVIHRNKFPVNSINFFNSNHTAPSSTAGLRNHSTTIPDPRKRG